MTLHQNQSHFTSPAAVAMMTIVETKTWKRCSVCTLTIGLLLVFVRLGDGFTPRQTIPRNKVARRASVVVGSEGEAKSPGRGKNFESRSKHWVVLVDDEESIRKAVGQFLFSKGYQVTACPSAQNALQVCRTRTQHKNGSEIPRIPDAIVSDIRMPGMDGLEFLREIRNDDRLVGVPVILLTAKGETDDRIAGYKSGADAYIPKPFNPDELLSIVDNAILRHETLNADNIQIDDLQREMADIKHLLLESGGGGIGNGWVEATNVFLGPFDRQVLELLCQGLVRREIASQLDISTRRVDSILKRLYGKANVSNRTELVRWAISTGNVRL